MKRREFITLLGSTAAWPLAAGAQQATPPVIAFVNARSRFRPIYLCRQRGDRMKVSRREFITLLGGAATGWPLAAHAQQPAMPVVGLLFTTSPDANPDRLRGFHRGLNESGYVEGENVARRISPQGLFFTRMGYREDGGQESGSPA
jgi:hypothetical protein